MLSFRTTGYNGYAVKYSPFFDSRIACAASANFGLVGTKRYHFSATIPCGVSCKIYNRPFPTSPKFADAAHAIRESKNGEYFTA